MKPAIATGTAAVDATMATKLTATHALLSGNQQHPLPGARVRGRANPNANIQVTLKVRRKAEIPDIVSRPSKIMTSGEIGEKYGATDADMALIKKVMASNGLRVVDTDKVTRTVTISGSIEQMEKTFQVQLFNYAHESGDYRGRVGDLYIPSELKDVLVGVIGLDNRCAVKPRTAVGLPPNIFRAKSLSVNPAWYLPAELAKHYSFPTGDGAGECIGILEFGGGYFPTDMKHFCKAASIATPTVHTISVDGTHTSAKDGQEGEVMLDVEVVAGVCPKASIVLYFAQFTLQGWMAAIDAAVHDANFPISVLSVSWGFAEKAFIWTDSVMSQVNETLKEAALKGITVCVASGDDGSSDSVMDGPAHADFPSTSPYVLSVGGTTIPVKGGTQPDITWKEGDGLRTDQHGSSGGGVSASMARPPWQSTINIPSVNAGSIVGRIIPDVAANADWDASPYALAVDGGFQPNGGTSAATPLWASLIALINAGRVKAGKTRLGYVTPVLYQTHGGSTIGAQGCVDVVKGDNVTSHAGGYFAGPGYDAVTGWGVPNGVNLAKALTVV